MMKLVAFGLFLVFVGTLLIILGMLATSWRIYKESEAKPEVRGGGVIMIGPFPIIFGTDVGSLKIVMILAIVLMIIATILLFLPFRMLFT
ncbi:MAG: TIGR00304 family membrane protein [Candidatus Methanospirareceae archaeon]